MLRLTVLMLVRQVLTRALAACLVHVLSHVVQVNEFDGYTELQFNPSHSSLGQKSAIISGQTWLVNVGMDVYAHPHLLIRDVLILSGACALFWMSGYASFRWHKYVR